MMTELSAFAVLAFVNCITPGPNNALAATTGARFGTVAGVAHATGVTAGCTVLVLLSAVGVAGFVATTPWLIRALALVSAAYLAGLTWRLLRDDTHALAQAARPPRFVDAVAFQLVNPKAWALALAGTALVLAPGDAPVVRVVAICVLQAVICLPCVMLWVALGARLQCWLTDARRRRAFNAAMALGLAGCALATLASAFTASV